MTKHLMPLAWPQHSPVVVLLNVSAAVAVSLALLLLLANWMLSEFSTGGFCLESSQVSRSDTWKSWLQNRHSRASL